MSLCKRRRAGWLSDQNTCRHLNTLLEFGSNYHVGCLQTITTVQPSELEHFRSVPRWSFGIWISATFLDFSSLRRILLEAGLEIRSRTNTVILTQSLRSFIISHLRNSKLWSRFTHSRIFPAQCREGSIVCGRVFLLELKNAGTSVQL